MKHIHTSTVAKQLAGENTESTYHTEASHTYSLTMAVEIIRARASYVGCLLEAITKRTHLSVPSCVLAANVLQELYKKADGHNSYMYGERECSQEPWTGWNRGEPPKPPAVWAPLPGNAQPEGRRARRTRREDEEWGKRRTGADADTFGKRASIRCAFRRLSC